MILDAYLVVAVGLNAYFLAVALSNVVYLRLATRPATLRRGPFVSVIVPARNEENGIYRCLDSLLHQDYEDYEVIVVDDHSSDSTAERVHGLREIHPSLRIVSAGPPPQGWLGKQHALAFGAAAARGEVLLLTDADTVHEPTSLSWAVTNLEHHGADMLSGYLRQQYGTLGESILVPTMYAMMLVLPLALLPRAKGRQPAFAIGQYVAIRKAALDAIGGYEAIKGSIVDDMSLARRVKAFGFRQVFLDAKSAASCRLYTGYRSAFHGIERSIYGALGASPVSVALVTAIVLAFIIAPALSVLPALAQARVPAGPLALACLLFVAQWGLIAADRDVPLVAFLLYPFVFLSLLAILLTSMMTTGFGRGIEWKGRTVRAHKDHTAEAPAPGRPRTG